MVSSLMFGSESDLTVQEAHDDLSAQEREQLKAGLISWVTQHVRSGALSVPGLGTIVPADLDTLPSRLDALSDEQLQRARNGFPSTDDPVPHHSGLY
jgi:hypothetical protein